MFYNDNLNNCCQEEKHNRQQGYCVKYIQEICCYPSYYNEKDCYDNKYDNKNNRDDCKKHTNCWQENDYDCNKKNYRKNNCCCCFNRLFRW